MARKARIVAANQPHHITQRGNNHQEVFIDREDRLLYLDLLAWHAEREQLDVMGYCLLGNHVHLVVVPRVPEALARGLGRAHSEYALLANRRHGRSGHLWQNRFYSCVLDDRHLWAALRYVERNPVRAGLVREAWEWEWSSARDHVGQRAAGPLPLRMAEWAARYRPEEWAECLRGEVEAREREALRMGTRNGWAVGSEEFCEELVARTGYRVRPLAPGRPRKAETVKEAAVRRASGLTLSGAQ
jgi:putative transposase